jgi:uncharacterized membrane protein
MSAIGTETLEGRRRRGGAVAANRAVHWLSEHWLLAFTVVWGLYVGLPWLAPVFMALGWAGPGRLIYAIYSTQCHQLPERSYFLFGQQPMYSLDQIGAVWGDTENTLRLRQFIGNGAMGWKVAWSDRMVSMYTSILFFGWLWWPLRRRIRSLPLWGFLALIAPMGLDGLTHTISDLAGIGHGFRDSNAWLAALTGNIFPAAFYAGDALGSFNSWMRILTGVLFALGTVWIAFPQVALAMDDARRSIEAKFARAGIPLGRAASGAAQDVAQAVQR